MQQRTILLHLQCPPASETRACGKHNWKEVYNNFQVEARSPAGSTILCTCRRHAQQVDSLLCACDSVYPKPSAKAQYNIHESDPVCCQLGLAALRTCTLLPAHTIELPLSAAQSNAAHLYSCCRRARRFWKSPIRSFSFLDSAAVMAVRVRSLEEPGPQPCKGPRNMNARPLVHVRLAVPAWGGDMQWPDADVGTAYADGLLHCATRPCLHECLRRSAGCFHACS